MRYRLLGRTGVQVSELCYGCMSFGGDADEAMSARMYRASREAGINFFDTADQYNKGRSEEILGELARGHREELVIATKSFNPTGEDLNARGNSRRHIARAVEKSLKRLQTDRVEILYLHQQDPLTPLEESMRALEDLVRAGKVLYPALSNHAAWQEFVKLYGPVVYGFARIRTSSSSTTTSDIHRSPKPPDSRVNRGVSRAWGTLDRAPIPLGFRRRSARDAACADRGRFNR